MGHGWVWPDLTPIPVNSVERPEHTHTLAYMCLHSCAHTHAHPERIRLEPCNRVPQAARGVILLLPELWKTQMGVDEPLGVGTSSPCWSCCWDRSCLPPPLVTAPVLLTALEIYAFSHFVFFHLGARSMLVPLASLCKVRCAVNLHL